MAGLAAAASPLTPASAADKPKVILGQSDRLITNSTVSTELVRRLLDDAMVALTGQADAHAAWCSLLGPDDIVGIKINALGGTKMFNRPELVRAVVDSLLRTGLPPGNIIIWEQFHSQLASVAPLLGYPIKNEPDDIRCYTSETKGMAPGFEDEPFTAGKTPVWFTRILTRQITTLINMPLLKVHQIAGITFALKNHYGSIKNPGQIHAGHCLEGGDLNAAPCIVNKTKLVVGDALWGLYDGTPAISKPECIYEQKALIVSENPVATDLVARDILDRKRQKEGLPPTGKRSCHVDRAAELGLGPKSLAGVDVVETTA